MQKTTNPPNLPHLARSLEFLRHAFRRNHHTQEVVFSDVFLAHADVLSPRDTLTQALGVVWERMAENRHAMDDKETI